jgi:hypothetical protein
MTVRAKAPLPHDATVFDILDTLSDPQRWFSKLLHDFSSIVRNSDKNARVRIGVSGNGSSPNYMISFQEGDALLHRCRDGLSDAVDWQIHSDGPGWSSASSSLDDVQTAFHKLPPSAFKKGR